MSRGEIFVLQTRGWIGTPVKWEASLKGIGCDCKGLVAGVARELGWPEGFQLEAGVVGYAIGGINEAQLCEGMDRIFDRVSTPAVGDVLGIRIQGKIQHLGVMSYEGRMIHAYSTGPSRVVEVPLADYWARRVEAIWRWRNVD